MKASAHVLSVVNDLSGANLEIAFISSCINVVNSFLKETVHNKQSNQTTKKLRNHRTDLPQPKETDRKSFF